MRDLSHLLDRMPTLREYDTAPPEHGGEDGSLPVYTLTPECIRYLTEEEIAEKIGQPRRRSPPATVASTTTCGSR